MAGSWDAGASARNSALPPLPPELDPRGKHRNKATSTARHGRRPGTVAAMVISAALSGFLVVYIGFLWSKVHNVDQKITHISIGALGGRSSSGGSAQRDIDGKDENLLLVGNDDRSDLTSAERKLLHTGSDVSLSTDTMLIVHIPADGSKATLISVPRDSYVAIPGAGMNKINSAYSYGYINSSGNTDSKRAAGADLLVKTIENLTGLNIDHYVQVGLIGFYRIAKAIGGVPVNLCKAVDDTVAHNLAEGSNGGSGLKISKGKHVLNAVQALEFVRQRHNLTNGDIDRTARQRYFLTAAFRKVASAGILLSPNKLGNLVDAVDKSIYVDSGLKILDLAEQMANLSANNIIGRAIPFEGYWNDSPVGSVERIDPAKVKAFVAKLVSPTDSAYTKAKTVSPKTVTVSVVNDGSHNGAATAATNVLKQQGFQATVGTSGSTQATTVIAYPQGMEAQAKTLAGYVPGASVKPASVTTLTLQLGSDGITAKAKTPSSSASSSTSSTSKSPKALDAGCIN